SHREKRSLSRIAWLQVIPFMLVIAMGTLLSFSRKKAKRKRVLTPKTRLSHKIMLVLCTVLLAGLLTAKTSSALTINTSKDTVIGFLGKGQKIYQKHIELTPEHMKQFTTRLGWTPDRTKYKAYYSKSDGQSVDAYVFILEDTLKACGGLHKYGIKVSAKGEVTGIKIIELTCDRSYCINNKAFLRQFKSFNSANAKDKAKTYDAMSGATLSTDLTLHIVRRALLLYEIIHGAVGG
ncbi:MAG: FMN-binding protein, partial [Desulfobacteraceae bacterium]